MMFCGSTWKPKRHHKTADKKQSDVFAPDTGISQNNIDRLKERRREISAFLFITSIERFACGISFCSSIRSPKGEKNVLKYNPKRIS